MIQKLQSFYLWIKGKKNILIRIQLNDQFSEKWCNITNSMNSNSLMQSFNHRIETKFTCIMCKMQNKQKYYNTGDLTI